MDFKEFILGLEQIGIKLKLADYRLIFDAIDYDQKGEVNFTKFCLLNTDRKSDLLKLKQAHANQQQSVKGKPPLAPVNGQHPLFGDNIPKNKDINGFTRDIQGIS